MKRLQEKILLEEPEFDDNITMPEAELSEPIKVDPTPEEVVDNGYAGLINMAITNEWSNINSYKDMIANFTVDNKFPEVVDILNQIIDDNTIIVGMLTKALEIIDGPQPQELMQQGIEKAENAISDVKNEEQQLEEPVEESLNLTDKLKKYNITDKEELRKKIDKVMTNVGYLINQNKFSKLYKEDWKFIKDVLNEYLTNIEE